MSIRFVLIAPNKIIESISARQTSAGQLEHHREFANRRPDLERAPALFSLTAIGIVFQLTHAGIV